jgi:hypothetical protein
MNLKPPDSSLDDYVTRRRTFMLALNASNPTPRERLDCMCRWMEANSPYTAAEKLENLVKALREDEAATKTNCYRCNEPIEDGGQADGLCVYCFASAGGFAAPPRS